jgi:hypothetical protein
MGGRVIEDRLPTRLRRVQFRRFPIFSLEEDTSMRANRWIGALTICTGGLLAAVVLAAGCGGKSEDAPVVEDTGTPDTGIAVVKDTSTPVDTAPVDTGMEPSGSLFDADIPDIVFEGGKTAKGCYDCTIDKCKTEVEACDKDAKCRSLLLCALTMCSSFSDTSCLFGCAISAGVTSPSDPVVATIQDVGTCNQMNCSASCPAIPDGGGMPPSDSGPKTDGSSTDGSSTDGSSATDGGSAPDGSGGSAFAPKVPAGKHVDAKVITVLQSVVASFEANPLARDGVVDHLSH